MKSSSALYQRKKTEKGFNEKNNGRGADTEITASFFAINYSDCTCNHNESKPEQHRKQINNITLPRALGQTLSDFATGNKRRRPWWRRTRRQAEGCGQPQPGRGVPAPGPSHGTPSGPRPAAVCPQTCPSLPCTPFTSSFPCDEPRNWKRSLFCYGFADRCSEASAAWMLAQRRCPPSPWPPWWEQPGDAWVFPERLPNPLCPCLPLVRLFPGQILPTQHPPLGLRGTGRAKAAIWGCSSWLPSSVSPLPRGEPRFWLFQGRSLRRGWEPLGPAGTASHPPRSHVSPRCSGQVGQ